MLEADRARFDTLLAEMSAGGLAGAATGTASGTAVGAATPLAIRGLSWSIREFRERVLGHREAQRVATVVDVAAREIRERLSDGEAPRSDDFFASAGGRRSDAEELLEGVLLAAQREYEDRKITYYGHLYASIAFQPEIDKVTANSLLREADGLSYTHLQLLALVERHGRFPLPPSNDQGASISWEAVSVRRTLDNLGYAQRELVAAKRRAGERLPTNIGLPSDLILTARGNVIHVLMRLHELPDEELRPLAAALWEYSGAAQP